MNKPRSKNPSKTAKRNPPASVAREPNDIFGFLKDEIEIVGDVLSPVVRPDDWDTLRES
jgi:hypothetical protein